LIIAHILSFVKHNEKNNLRLDIFKKSVYNQTYNMFKVITAAAAALLVFLLFSSCGREGYVSRTAFLLDTAVTADIHAADNENAKKAADDVFGVLEEQDRLLSELYGGSAANALSYAGDLIDKTEALNAQYGYDVNIFCGGLTRLWGISTDKPRVPPESEIKAALSLIPKGKADLIPGETAVDPNEAAVGSNETAVYSDETAVDPGAVFVDPGAVGKGYALDKAKAALDNANISYAAVSAESSVLLYGEKQNGEPFYTGIKNPAGGYIGYVKTGAAFISTAGGEERFFEADGKKYIHILDLKTGCPAISDLASVTVIIPADEADGGIKSDFLSTAMFIGGADKLSSFGVTYVAIGTDGTIFSNTEVFTDYDRP
jgi:thiamine biosynthesis lipoprotein